MKQLYAKLICCVGLISFTFGAIAQNSSLQPFENCPGTSVAISRPGINSTVAPYQIYVVDAATGAMAASGNPINLQINGFGLNGQDGFLYGMHESSNVANPSLARVDKTGAFEDLGTLVAPVGGAFTVGVVNTAAGTIDDKGNYYFTAIVVNSQNVNEPPRLFVGKLSNIASLTAGAGALPVVYTEITLGTCADELAALLMNPLNGALQDIAYNVSDGNIYTYFTGFGKFGHFNPNSTPTLDCKDPLVSNPVTQDLAGLFFDKNGALFILTTDGKYYKGDISSGAVSLITQTTLPLIAGNLRGDMASCVGKPVLVAFDDCPGVAVVISRPGINSTRAPFQIFQIDPTTGNITATGTPINLQINGFGLNSKDGFLYAMHESSNVTDPFFTRVGKNGLTEDIGKLTAPPASGNMVGIINTAGGTMDGGDNYYFTAVVADTTNFAATAKLMLGKIEKVSTLHAGDAVTVAYKQVALGSCADEIAAVLANPASGLLQDFAFNPRNNRIYTYIPSTGGSPASGKVAFLGTGDHPEMNCIDPPQTNPVIQDLAGMFFGPGNHLYILTIDGKYYSANINNGKINLVTQTQLPLISGNLRGDMASCVKKKAEHPMHDGHDNDDGDEDDDEDGDHDHQGDNHFHMSVSPNPVGGNEIMLTVNCEENAKVELILIDAYSRIAIKKPVRLVKGNNRIAIDISRLMRGFGSIVLSFSSGRRESIKFIRL